MYSLRNENIKLGNSFEVFPVDVFDNCLIKLALILKIILEAISIKVSEVSVVQGCQRFESDSITVIQCVGGIINNINR